MALIGAIAGIIAAEALGGGFFAVVGIPSTPASFTFLAILGAAAGGTFESLPAFAGRFDRFRARLRTPADLVATQLTRQGNGPV
jgi:hypothetical protein